MPIMNVIKNNAYGNMLCYKVPCEDFNIGSQLIVAEYEEALFVKDGVIEYIFGPGKYTLNTNNYPFLTKFLSKLLSGGVSAYSCKIYYINKSHHLEQKWGTITPLHCLDPKWGIEVNVQGRGAYTVAIKNGKKFFIKLIGANAAASEKDIVKQFRTAFVQNITDELFEYINSSKAEIIITCNRKKALATSLTPILNEILEEYGLELINFYIENIGIPENDDSMRRIRELRIKAQENEFQRQQYFIDEQNKFAIHRQKADTERYISGQKSQAQFEHVHILNQDGNNLWQQQQAVNIASKAVENGNSNPFIDMGMGIQLGHFVGNMAGNIINEMDTSQVQNSNQENLICPNCNAVNPTGMKFCGSCGSELTPPKSKCPNCGAELIKGMKFCGQCGHSLQPPKNLCPNCQKELPTGTKFCGFCGTKINL